MKNNKSQWHKYPDEKPNHDKAVLIKIKYDDYIHKAMYIKSQWYVLYDDEALYQEHEYECYDLDDITHWMELPEPPKEEEV